MSQSMPLPGRDQKNPSNVCVCMYEAIEQSASFHHGAIRPFLKLMNAKICAPRHEEKVQTQHAVALCAESLTCTAHFCGHPQLRSIPPRCPAPASYKTRQVSRSCLIQDTSAHAPTLLPKPTPRKNRLKYVLRVCMHSSTFVKHHLSSCGSYSCLQVWNMSPRHPGASWAPAASPSARAIRTCALTSS